MASLVFMIAISLFLHTSAAFTSVPLRSALEVSFCTLKMASTNMMEAMSEAVSKPLGKTITLEPASGGSYSGGGGALTIVVIDPETNTMYFGKSAGGGHDMLKA
jgi:hypothetical protein